MKYKVGQKIRIVKCHEDRVSHINIIKLLMGKECRIDSVDNDLPIFINNSHWLCEDEF